MVVKNPITGQEYMVHFHHVEVPTKVWKHGKMIAGIRRATQCTIHPAPCTDKARPCNTPGAIRVLAECSPKDSFNKLKGRKLSFGRAIVKLGLNKMGREWLWSDFRSQLSPKDDGYLAAPTPVAKPGASAITCPAEEHVHEAYVPRSIEEVLNEGHGPNEGT